MMDGSNSTAVADRYLMTTLKRPSLLKMAPQCRSEWAIAGREDNLIFSAKRSVMKKNYYLFGFDLLLIAYLLNVLTVRVHMRRSCFVGHM